MSEQKNFKTFAELSGIGIEMAAAAIIGMLLGILFDRYVGTSPWGLIVGTILGIAAAIKRIIDIVLAQENKK